MPRTSVPWATRCTEHAVEEQVLIAQAKRESDAVDRLIAEAHADLERAERRIAAAGRIEVNQHATLAKAEKEAHLLAGMLERATADVREMVRA